MTFPQRIAGSKFFQRFIVGVIVLAGALAGLETSAALVQNYGPLLRAADRLILAIFIAEAALKMAALAPRPWRYFHDGWNVFDFLIVVICLIPAAGPFAIVLRLARILRLLRLVSTLPKLQLLVGALLKSLSGMGYVSLLLGLLFYIYAVAGVHLFGPTDPARFGSLPKALVSLLQIVTLDNWGDLYAAQAVHVPAFKVMIYFATFIVLGTMIILNLFIGIIMNSMAEMHTEIAQQPDGRPRQPGAAATLEDDLQSLETAIRDLQARVQALRRKPAGGFPPPDGSPAPPPPDGS